MNSSPALLPSHLPRERERDVSVVTAEPNSKDLYDVYMRARGGAFAHLPPLPPPPPSPFFSILTGESLLHGFHRNVDVLLIFYDPSVFLYSVLFNILKINESVCIS